jgi:hypothetical protein
MVSRIPYPEVIGKAFPGLILDINKALRLWDFFLERNVQGKRGHSVPVY